MMSRVIQLLCVLLSIKDKNKCNTDCQRKKGGRPFFYKHKFSPSTLFFIMGYSMVYRIVSKLSSMSISIGKSGVIKKKFSHA